MMMRKLLIILAYLILWDFHFDNRDGSFPHARGNPTSVVEEIQPKLLRGHYEKD